MKRFGMRTVLVACACILAVCTVVLTGCGSKGAGTLSSEIIAETGAFKATASDAKLDAGVGASAAITIKDGDVLMVSPDLTQGKMQVTLTDDSGKVAFDQEVSGRVLDTYEVDPGTYDINMTCKEAGTTGTVLAASNNKEELAAQDKALDEALEEAGVETEK